MSFIKQIKKVCEKYPYTNQALTSAILQVAGEIIAQKFVERNEKLDIIRCRDSFIIGYFGGLMLRKWYDFLEKRFMHPNPLGNAVRKVAGELDASWNLYCVK